MITTQPTPSLPAASSRTRIQAQTRLQLLIRDRHGRFVMVKRGSTAALDGAAELGWGLPGGVWPYDGRGPDRDGPATLAYGDVLRWMVWKQLTLDIVPRRPLLIHCEHGYIDGQHADRRAARGTDGAADGRANGGAARAAVRSEVVWLFDGGIHDALELEQRGFFLDKPAITEWQWAQRDLSLAAATRLCAADWHRVDHAVRNVGSLSVLETPAPRRRWTAAGVNDQRRDAAGVGDLHETVTARWSDCSGTPPLPPRQLYDTHSRAWRSPSVDSSTRRGPS